MYFHIELILVHLSNKSLQEKFPIKLKLSNSILALLSALCYYMPSVPSITAKGSSFIQCV